MSERPFHCIPGELWLDDEVLDGVSDDAEMLFRKFADASDRDWRIRVSSADDSHAYAHSLRGRLFRGVTKTQRWNKSRIDMALRELRAQGLLTVQVHEERHWLELAPRLQYRKGEDRGQLPGPLVQAALPLSGELLLLPEPPSGGVLAPRRGLAEGKNVPKAPQCSESRVEQKRIENTESPALPGSDRFGVAADVIAATTLGNRLLRFFGMQQRVIEARESGKEWMRILREEGEELAELLEQGERLPRTELPTGLSKAKWLVKRLKERRAA